MSVLVIGVGHPDRGDDAAGPEVVRRLRPGSGLVTRTVTGDPLTVLADPVWSAADRIVLVDAAVSGAPPGTVHRWAPSDPGGGPWPTHAGSHGFGVAEVLALAEALDRLPDDVTVVAIEAGDLRLGVGLSPAVADAVDTVVTDLRADLRGEVGRRVHG